MDPLPSKMPRKPRSETPIDYTGKMEWLWIFFIRLLDGCFLYSKACILFEGETWLLFFFFFLGLICIVQIPPSTTYVPPMKRPMEEEESTDEKNPNKKKKKLQKKCKCSSYVHNSLVVEICTHCTKKTNLFFAVQLQRRRQSRHRPWMPWCVWTSWSRVYSTNSSLRPDPSMCQCSPWP